MKIKMLGRRIPTTTRTNLGRTQGDTVPNRVKAYRTNAGLSQFKLAMLIQLSPQAIQQIEAGQYYPRSDKLAAMMAIFGCALHDLFPRLAPELLLKELGLR